jgi:hypothetical protein
MKPQYDGESFSSGIPRSAGFALRGGADPGKILITRQAITGGDEASRHRAAAGRRRTAQGRVVRRSRRRDDDHGRQAVA